MQGAPIPPEIAARFEVAPARPRAREAGAAVSLVATPTAERAPRARRAPGAAGSSPRGAPRCGSRGETRFYTRKLEAAGLGASELRFPRDLQKLPFTTKAELVADQAANPPWGTALTRAARPLHALLPDVVDHRSPAALDRHQRELAVAARVLEGRVPRGPCRPGRPRLLSVLVRPLSRLLGGVRRRLADRRAVRAGRRHVEPAAAVARSHGIGATVVCCTPTYALRLAEVAAAERRVARATARCAC